MKYILALPTVDSNLCVSLDPITCSAIFPLANKGEAIRDQRDP